MGPRGFEPRTHRSSAGRSPGLSYGPVASGNHSQLSELPDLFHHYLVGQLSPSHYAFYFETFLCHLRYLLVYSLESEGGREPLHRSMLGGEILYKPT
jgi:hypothetical protein